MIKKVKKGQRLWVVDIHDKEIEVGIASENISETHIDKIIDENRTINVDISADDVIYTHLDDVFSKRKEAIQELIVRLKEERNHTEEKLSFLNKELNKKGNKRIALPTHKYKSRFQARMT